MRTRLLVKDLAPRNIAGSLMLFGDLYAKGGDATAAASSYAISNLFSSGWRFRSAIEDRVQTIDQRIAFSQDADLANDPLIAGTREQTCAMCHNR